MRTLGLPAHLVRHGESSLGGPAGEPPRPRHATGRPRTLNKRPRLRFGCIGPETSIFVNGCSLPSPDLRRQAHDPRPDRSALCGGLRGVRLNPIGVRPSPDRPASPTGIGPAPNGQPLAADDDPQHRDHRPHRRRQDDDHRAHPLLHGRNPQDGGRRQGEHRHRLPPRGTRARDHDRRGGDHLQVEGRERRSDQHHRHARATSTSRPRSSGRCASSTGRSSSSRPSRGSRRRARRSGGRRRSITCRGSASSTRWTGSAPSGSGSSGRSPNGSKACRSPSRSPSARGRKGRWASSAA